MVCGDVSRLGALFGSFSGYVIFGDLDTLDENLAVVDI